MNEVSKTNDVPSHFYTHCCLLQEHCYSSVSLYSKLLTNRNKRQCLSVTIHCLIKQDNTVQIITLVSTSIRCPIPRPINCHKMMICLFFGINSSDQERRERKLSLNMAKTVTKQNIYSHHKYTTPFTLNPINRY